MTKIDLGSVPAWISALTPLIAAGVLNRALNRTTHTIKEAVRVTRRPLTLRQRLRLRTLTTAPRPDPRHHPPTGGHQTPHQGEYVDGTE